MLSNKEFGASYGITPPPVVAQGSSKDSQNTTDFAIALDFPPAWQENSIAKGTFGLKTRRN